MRFYPINFFRLLKTSQICKVASRKKIITHVRFQTYTQVPCGNVKHGFKYTVCEFRFTSYEFNFTGYEFKSTSCEFKFMSYEFISTSNELKSTS